jgi:hypothetical protein
LFNLKSISENNFEDASADQSPIVAQTMNVIRQLAER